MMAVYGENVSLDYPHYALIFTDKDGLPHKQFSPSLARDGSSIISDETTGHFLAAVARYKRSSCDEQVWKRRRFAPTAASGIHRQAMSTMIRHDDERLRSYYEKAFECLLQTNCRVLAKAYIKLIEPHKQWRYPYNGRVYTADGTKQHDPEVTKPPWWPSGVIHRDPDHLLKKDRIQLLVSIICDLHTTHGITVEKLRRADQAVRRHISPPERLQILDEVYSVRGEEEKAIKWPQGERDAQANLAIPTVQSLPHSINSAPKDHQPLCFNSSERFHNYPHGHSGLSHANISQRMDSTADPFPPSNEVIQQHMFFPNPERFEPGLNMAPSSSNKLAPSECRIASSWSRLTMNMQGWEAASPHAY